ncbi:MAG: PD-(D/E)XK nuclease-like domain-containing protein [Bacteroidales bacterium]|nr:PD-(D/E)XK nuclease-like domain-containing protein [Lachnoclostridium sp.]MCM1385278.1 PD-(D/E)XK nuclease-like domain-containing protein [Lachnoclostridium sp.]MCM1466136.1 PD-(D/E)XK nuclease-like domain-containing protein [Bacteroidales bacterium]
MKLNDDNYYSKESNQAFFSVSQYKDFMKCEAMALAKIRGEYEQPTTKAMLIGTLVDRWFEGTLDKLRAESPNIFFCRNGALRAEFRKADQIIKRVTQDERFMQYMSGEKQKILTFEMFGVPWKMKMDSFVEGICITDLKVVQNFKSLAFWRYDLQGAMYQAGVIKCFGDRLPFYLAAATKENVTNFDIFQIDQPTLDLALKEIAANMPRFIAVKQGIEEPHYCGVCDYCKSVKKARIRNYSELLEG